MCVARQRLLAPLADGIVVVESSMGGEDGRNGVFLIAGERPVLVEAGTAVNAARVARTLTAVGIGPTDLAAIVLTHAHLDHAGGAGELARLFPAATVLVHPDGARHLADPAPLVAGARRAHGPLLETVSGLPQPVHPDRIRALPHGALVPLGAGRRLVAVHTPGHSPDHLALLDTGTGAVFTGDAAGIRTAGMRVARPATPPPSFDATAAAASHRRIAALRPELLILTHFGAVSDPEPYLSELTSRLWRWCAAAQRIVAAGGTPASVESELVRRFAAEEGLPLTEPIRFAASGGYRTNAAGLHHWSKAGHRPSGPGAAAGPLGSAAATSHR
jgi:glyoxylase-like metal-dependent hydrolase (beta-lactamase superfamily II)